MKHYLSLILMLIAGCIFTSCSDDDEVQTGKITLIAQESIVPEGAALQGENITVSMQGGSFLIPISCGLETSSIKVIYKVTSSDINWCKATTTGNQLKLKVEAAQTSEERLATVKLQAITDAAQIAPVEINVRQTGRDIVVGNIVLDSKNLIAPESTTLDDNTLQFSYSGGNASIPINTFTKAGEAIEVNYEINQSSSTAKWLKVSLEEGILKLATKPTAFHMENVAQLIITATGKKEPTEITPLKFIVKQAKFSAAMNMAIVEGGTYTFGKNREDSREVTLTSFYMSTTEITQALYEEVMGENPSDSKYKGNNYPVNKMTWSQACEFCNKLSEREGLTPAYTQNGTVSVPDAWGYGTYDMPNYVYDPTTVSNGYRLPTSAEWEFAAKGGVLECNNFTTYPGSNNIDEVAWYQENSEGDLHEVAQKKANALGIYDLGGNIGEWCYDWGVGIFYEHPKDPVTDPIGPEHQGYGKIYRGGYYSTYASKCGFTDTLDRQCPEEGKDIIGFRVVRTIK